MIEAPLVCFFDLMKGCNKSPEDCENTHVSDNAAKYLSYDGPVWNDVFIATQKLSNSYFPFIYFHMIYSNKLKSSYINLKIEF